MGLFRLLRAWLQLWLTDLGPNRDAHNERIKLIAGSLNAVSLAGLIGGVIGPVLEGGGGLDFVALCLGALIWLGAVVAAFRVLAYIRAKE